MNHLIPPAEAEQGFDILRTMAGQDGGVGAGIGHEAAREAGAGGREYVHRIAALEMAGDGGDAGGAQRRGGGGGEEYAPRIAALEGAGAGGDAGGKQRRAASQSAGGAVIDGEGA